VSVILPEWVKMSEIPKSPPPAPSPHVTVAGRGWKSALRWFAAEFVVVVAGILVALAVSSWAQQQQENKREQAYLRQLSADLQTSEKQLGEAVGLFDLRAQAAARVLHRFWRNDLSVDDALSNDLGLPRSTRRFRPVLGTAEALTTSGDLNLIRSDPLRAQIVAYLESMKTTLEDINRYDETYYRPAMNKLYAGPDLYQFVNFKSKEYNVLPRPEQIERVPFPTTLPEMLRDRRVYDGYNSLLVAHRNQSDCYRDMLEQSKALRASVEAAIEK
jgi:type II secretory pathway pseudopilin PulG